MSGVHILIAYLYFILSPLPICIAYLYCISLLHVFIEYLHCISLLHIFIAYLECRSLLHTLIAYISFCLLIAFLYCRASLHICTAYLYIYHLCIASLCRRPSYWQSPFEKKTRPRKGRCSTRSGETIEKHFQRTKSVEETSADKVNRRDFSCHNTRIRCKNTRVEESEGRFWSIDYVFEAVPCSSFHLGRFMLSPALFKRSDRVPRIRLQVKCIQSSKRVDAVCRLLVLLPETIRKTGFLNRGLSRLGRARLRRSIYRLLTTVDHFWLKVLSNGLPVVVAGRQKKKGYRAAHTVFAASSVCIRSFVVA